ncbi:MAG: hypothetical protein MIL41_06570, partial [Hyphomicrobiales bacterium]
LKVSTMTPRVPKAETPEVSRWSRQFASGGRRILVQDDQRLPPDGAGHLHRSGDPRAFTAGICAAGREYGIAA